MPIFTARDQTPLHYDDWGTGAPVVLVHGWTLCNEMWDYQLPALTQQGLRCVAPDRRGHGRSSRPGAGYDLDTLADDLAALLEHLDLRGVTLVSHSMGGAEVARYLARHGAARVARNVLISPSTPYLRRADDNPHGLDPALFDQLADALRSDRAAWFAANAPGFFGVGLPDCPASAATIDWGVRLCLATPLKIQLDTLRTYSETDSRPDLAAISTPTVVIHGDADHSAVLELTGRPTAALIRGARLEVYHGAPHGLFITHKDRLNRDLLGIIAGA